MPHYIYPCHFQAGAPGRCPGSRSRCATLLPVVEGALGRPTRAAPYLWGDVCTFCSERVACEGCSGSVRGVPVGVLYAAVSAYWGLGGTGLVDTIGGTLEREGRAGSAGLLTVLWVTVVVKLVVASLGLAAVLGHRWVRPRQRQLARRAASTAALILVLYGGVLTVAGLLVQLDLVHASANADHKALRWHAFLWDPWFLVWGLLLAGALARPRVARSKQGPGRAVRART